MRGPISRSAVRAWSATRQAPVQARVRQAPRFNSSAAGAAPEPRSKAPLLLAIGAAALAGGYYFYKQQAQQMGLLVTNPAKADYERVYKQVADRLEENNEYDDGSYGPVLLRLAWHCAGTYDKETKTGGSDGATMRFSPERDHGANAGLAVARDFLEPVKKANPWISYSDLWILAGICAIQEMGGPTIRWRPGRSDRDASFVSPDGRLPDASKDQSHLRAIFHRMGFDDREIVALSGAHALGRCHTDRSGYVNPWTNAPTYLTNDYYKLLMDEKWSLKKWDGPPQFEDKTTKSLMMLPTDLALVKDKNFRKHVERYAKSQEVFFKEFAEVIEKLFELGCDFKDKEYWTFKPINA